MDVVTHAGTISCRIVVAKNAHMVALPVRDLQHDGDEVRLGVMRLADLAGHMRAAGVEVAQRHKVDAVRDGRPVEHPLHGELRLTVAVGRMGRIGLQNGDALRLAVGRGSRGKDDVFDTVLDHALQHRPRAAEVVVVILERIDHALANLRVRGKVDDRVDLFAGKDVVAEFLVPNIALVEARLGMHRSPEACLQIVRHDNVVAVVNEFIYGVTADVAGAA